MHELTAQVTSSLLPFTAVTLEAVGEDEITLESMLHGKFTVGRGGHAWLACGPHLELIHGQTRERLSAYRFSDGGEHPPCVLTARDFSWLKRSGLLVGLEETEGSILCLYDFGLSIVTKAVVIPGRITAIEPLVSYGGASTSTQHLHQSLRWFFGIVAVVTDLGHVLLVDLCLDDLSCSRSEQNPSSLQVVNKSQREIPRLREASSAEGRHLSLQLNAPNGVPATALQYIPRTNQLAVGFSDGYLQLWNLKSLREEYHSQLDGGRVPVHAFTFQEPENDPRNCCYLWAVQSSQDQEGDTVSLHLLQMAFSERKCLATGKILYEGLEYCEERYSQELSGTAFTLTAQASSTRLLRCQTVEKFRPHPDRDESMNEVASPDTSISIFSWQVKTYGQATPSTYIGVFDINRWYHAQMPDSFRMGESLRNCPYLAVWCLDPVTQMASPHTLLDVVIKEDSLSRGLPLPFPPPEQYFHPTAYNFDASCLFNSGIVHSTCCGYPKETLSFLRSAAPCSSDAISSIYSRCLMSGLLSSRLADAHTSSISQEDQLDAILATAVETCSLKPITDCIKQWTTEEQPGSALNLRYILDWAWNKVIQTKEELDTICAPLFDSSSNFTDPQTLQLMQHSQRLLKNLSIIFHCLLTEAQELTQKGLVGLTNKSMVSNLISKYVQVVLWFCRTGLLPEGSDVDAMQLSRPFYSYSVINNYYSMRREELTTMAKGKWCADCLMIDSLVGQCGEPLANLWKRDEGGTGQYPPPTIHALLDIYLLDSVDEATKHAIVIYLLLDVMYSFPDKEAASVESFPTAFDIPFGLVKLVQGLWLLDNRDHQRSFDLLLNPAAFQCHFGWQHERVLQALMCQGQHSLALRYFHSTQTPINSMPLAKLCLSVLLHNRCLTEAWVLLRQHSNHLNATEMLGFMYESCQELGLIKELLKLPLGPTEQDALEKFLQEKGGLQNKEILMVHYLQRANYIPALRLMHSLKMQHGHERDPKLKERSNIRNSIMDLCGKVLPRVQRKLAMEGARPYQHPRPIHKEVTRPQPLSTITKRCSSEVMSRAGFINNVLTKIEEVWLGIGESPSAKSPRQAGFLSPPLKPAAQAQPEPFLGTPIRTSSKRFSRLMDVMVQSPQPFLSPPRPSWARLKSTTKAPEFSLLQTPPIVKRARAMAISSGVFSDFAPQSILRSTPKPNPLATPSASSVRSITPPLRSKENRITFNEVADSPEPGKDIHWTNGVAAESEINLLTKGIGKPHTRKSLSAQPDKDEEADPTHVKLISTQSPDATQARISLSFNASQTTETSLEYFDAPLSHDHQGDGEHINFKKGDDVMVVDNDFSNNNSMPASDLAPLQIPNEEKDQELEEEETLENVMEIAVEQVTDDNKAKQGGQNDAEGLDKDETDCKMDRKKDPEPGIKPEDVDIDQELPCHEGDELLDTAPETESQPQPFFSDDTAAQLEVLQSTAILEHLTTHGDTEAITITQQENTCEHGEVQQQVNTHEHCEIMQRVNTHEHCEITQQVYTHEYSEITEQVNTHELGEVPEQLNTHERGEVTEQVNTREVTGQVTTCEGSDVPEQVNTLEHGELTQQMNTLGHGEVTQQVNTGEHGEVTKFIQCMNTFGETEVDAFNEAERFGDLQPTDEVADNLDHTTDLTAFVDQHLFGSGLSPPLTRSGIHDSSNEDEHVSAEALPVFTSQKSTTTTTTTSSSDSSSTDSHSLVSLNDSEDTSSSESEEEEEENVEKEEASDEPDEVCNEQEEEDSGSEVEIIQEVQGNGSLRALGPNMAFAHEDHGHILSTFTEQQSTEFSLVPPGVEMKMVGEELEGEVLMVRLGADTEAMEALEAEGPVASYMELKPSTTLLVPLELVDGQQDVIDDPPLELPGLQQPNMVDEQMCETHGNFSLILDTDGDGGKEVVEVATDNVVTEPEVILLAPDSPKSKVGTPEDPGQIDLQVNDNESELKVETPQEQVENAEELDPVILTDSEPLIMETAKEVLEDRDDNDFFTVQDANKEEPEQDELVPEVTEAPKFSEDTEIEQTPKRRSARISTLRKSSLGLNNISEADIKQEFITPTVKKSSRKTRLKPVKEEESETPIKSTPSSVTRRSKHVTLDVCPQSAIKSEENIGDGGQEPKKRSVGRPRKNRNKLWDNPQEEVLLLPTPLEVDSETPVAEALIKRLQDKEGTEQGVFRRILRTRKTMSSVVEEDNTNPEDQSLVTRPSRRRTRDNIAESPGPTEELVVTSNKKRGVQKTSKETFISEEDHMEEVKAVSKRRKTAKRTTKSAAASASDPLPLVEAVLISPLSSPATEMPQAKKRAKAGDARKSSAMTLRRKHLIDNIFTKPVTRRKNL
ncbi:protein ELYS isoform X2 [Stigmatopora nigra]